LTPQEQVHLLVDDAATEAKVRAQLKDTRGVATNLIFHLVPTVDSWIRDYGPNFLKASSGGLAYNHWIFNALGDKYESLKADAAIPRKLAPFLDLPSFEPGIVLEGGSIDVNGRGTLLTTEQCLLNRNRNPSLSRAEIETYLQEYLGVSQVLWLG